jgi:hypothetical protein
MRQDRLVKRFRSLQVAVTVFGYIIMLAQGGCARVLWGDAALGMTPDEVQRVIPNGASIRVKSGFSPSLSDGSLELVRVRDIEFADVRFFARYYFLDNRLHQITLSAEEDAPFEANVDTWKSLVAALRKQHGQELTYLIEPKGLFPHAKAQWRYDGVSLQLFVLGVEDAASLIEIRYRAATE